MPPTAPSPDGPELPALSDVKTFADALPQLLWVARPDGSVEFVNRAWCRFTGRDAADLCDWGWTRVLAPGDRERAMRYWSDARALGEPSDVKLRVAQAAGGYRVVRGRNVPVRDESGRVAYWVGWCVDVDEMRASEDQIRSLADTMPALVFTVAADGDRLAFVNRAWREYTGLGVGTTLEQRMALIHPDDAPALRRALRDRAPQVELRIRRASDGKYRWHHMRWQRFSAADGSPVSRVGTLLDIDDEKRAAEMQTFLAEAGRTINKSLDLERTVRSVAHLAVPTLADWCQIDLPEHGTVVTRAFAHRDPAINERCKALIGHVHSIGSHAYERIADAIRRGKPVVTWRVQPEMAENIVTDPLLRELYGAAGYASSMILPLAVRGRIIGSIALVRNDAQRAYAETDLTFALEFARAAALAIDNALLFGREHRVADAMQSASLPKALPKIPSIDMHAIYVPGHGESIVGGDWYDAFRLRDGRLVVSIGDVSGSGIDAAVAMSNMRQIIRGTAQVHADPVLMLNAADRALRLEESDRFVTAFVAVIDPISRSIVYANAGHPPPYVRDPQGHLQQLAFEDLPLGLRQKNATRPKTAHLAAGSLLVFYTDGLIESKRDVVGGIAALERVLASEEFAEAANPAKFVRAKLLGDGVRDDIAILTVRMRANDRDLPRGSTQILYRWRYDFVAPELSHELRRRFRRALAEHGIDAAATARAELVLGELVGNIVRHAPGGLEVIVDLSSPAPVLHVIDEGPGFERAPMLPSDLLSESGRGLFIVSELTDEFSVSRGPNGGSHARAVLAT